MEHSSASTVQTAHNELRSLIQQLNPQQLPILITLISDPQDLSTQARKEYLKVFALVSEMKGAELADQVKRIIQIVNKRIMEGSTSLHQIIAETLGTLNECTIQKSEFPSDLLFQVINVLQSNFAHNNKSAQQVSAMALTRVIQTTQIQILQQIMGPYVHRTIEILRTPVCQSYCGLLESLLSLLLTVESDYQPHCAETCQIILECLNVEEWSARKVAIDLLYTLAVIIPSEISKYSEQMISKLMEARKDKIKYVREAAQVAIVTLKEITSNGGQMDPQRESQKEMSQRLQRQTSKGRSIFKQAMNEDFFKQAKNDIEIKENNPKTSESTIYDSRVQNYHQNSYSPQDSIKKISPPHYEHNLNTVSPLVNRSIPKHNQSYYDSLSKNDNRGEDRFSALQDKYQSQISSLTRRVDYMEQLMEHIYFSLLKNNLIPISPSMLQGNLRSDEYEPLGKYQAQTAKFNFTVTDQIPFDEDILRSVEDIKNSTIKFSQDLEKERFSDMPLRKSYTDMAEEKYSSHSIGKMRPSANRKDVAEPSENLQEVYGLLLIQPDDEPLLEMMSRTGPCCSKLDPNQVEFLLNKLRIMLINQEHVPMAIDWIYDALLHYKSKFSDIQLKKLLETFNKMDCYEGQKVIEILTH